MRIDTLKLNNYSMCCGFALPSRKIFRLRKRKMKKCRKELEGTHWRME